MNFSGMPKLILRGKLHRKKIFVYLKKNTVDRDINWLTVQYTAPKVQTLNEMFTLQKVRTFQNIFILLSPVPHVDEAHGGVEGGHHDVGDCQVQQEIVGHAPHPTVSWKMKIITSNGLMMYRSNIYCKSLMLNGIISLLVPKFESDASCLWRIIKPKSQWY